MSDQLLITQTAVEGAGLSQSSPMVVIEGRPLHLSRKSLAGVIYAIGEDSLMPATDSSLISDGEAIAWFNWDKTAQSSAIRL
jgi:hypothetical protein